MYQNIKKTDNFKERHHQTNSIYSARVPCIHDHTIIYILLSGMALGYMSNRFLFNNPKDGDISFGFREP